MRKRKIFSILLGVILLLAGVLGVVYIIFTIINPSQQIPLIRIYVNSTIYNSIDSELNQYQKDIESEGYQVNLVNWSNSNPAILKSNINNSYHQYNLKGAIFIGKMPFVYGRYSDDYGYYRVFPCDLYFMDLDGNWSDTVTYIGYYDIDQNEHNNGTGDWTPEIWLARINPNSMNYTNVNYTSSYENYFDRNHKYHQGISVKRNKALLYIDDDWSFWSSDWLNAFKAYNSTQTNCYYNNPTTTAQSYMNNLTITVGAYDFVHLLVHSSQHNHLFGPSGDGSDGTINYQNILSNNTTPYFYNLYACYACDYLIPNNLGTHYLFSGNTLTVIGSARNGGMDLYEPFYDELKKGNTIGEAFRIWFHNPEIVKWNKEQLYYGMTIFGDPLLTI